MISQAFQDLSHSDFSGSIPAKFSASSSLVLPNMSFNDISGSIPSNNVFRLMGSSAYEGNPKLRGAPLNHILLPLLYSGLSENVIAIVI